MKRWIESSAPSSPWQTDLVLTLLLMLFQSICQTHSLFNPHKETHTHTRRLNVIRVDIQIVSATAVQQTVFFVRVWLFVWFIFYLFFCLWHIFDGMIVWRGAEGSGGIFGPQVQIQGWKLCGVGNTFTTVSLNLCRSADRHKGRKCGSRAADFEPASAECETWQKNCSLSVRHTSLFLNRYYHAHPPREIERERKGEK